MEMDETRIAMCQIVCLDGDRRGNLARIENAVREAKQAGAALACLPETAIYGWVNPDAHRRAHPIPGDDSQRLCELARKQGIHLCIGLAEKDGERLYDAAILISDEGQILLKHRKINLLGWLMSPPYSPGQDVTAVETAFGRIGVLICADTHEQDILRRMADLQPDLVLVPYGYAAEENAWPDHGKALERVVANAAKIIGAPVIGTNLIGQITHGPWTGRTYGGHSVATILQPCPQEEKRVSVQVVARDFDRDIRLVVMHRHRSAPGPR
jgi:predicted amidohydrolase